MQFLYSIWKIFHPSEYFYMGTAHGARNNYQVCSAASPTNCFTLYHDTSPFNLVLHYIMLLRCSTRYISVPSAMSPFNSFTLYHTTSPSLLLHLSLSTQFSIIPCYYISVQPTTSKQKFICQNLFPGTFTIYLCVLCTSY